MKNAMKKIMSLVLVAMILVSAVPFAASADSGDMCEFWIELNLDGTHIDSKKVPVPVGTTMNEAAVKQYAADAYGTYFGSGYTYAGCYDIGGQAGVDGYIGAGIKFETKAADPDPVEPEMINFWIELNVDGKVIDSQIVSVPKGTVMDAGTVKLYAEKHLYGQYFSDGYTYVGCYDFGGQAGVNGYNGAGIKFTTNTTNNGTSTNNGTGTSESGYHKLSGTVTLRIQLKGTSTYKDIAIKDGIAADGKVTLNEVKSVVKYYYNAIDTDTGIVYDGIYIDDSVYGLWMSYAHDVKYDTVLGLYEAASQNNDVRLTVVISNAKAATSSNADSSNPKTGDTIMMPVAVMTVSASLLAVAFFMNKKRAF